MDALPLPPRPDLAQYKKRAKDLVAISKTNDPEAVRAWAREWLETLARLRGIAVTQFVRDSFDRAVDQIEKRVHELSAPFTLASAQHFVASAHGFDNWAEFARHVEQSGRKDGDPFESAADAVVGGDLATLESLVRRDPQLVHARSARVHKATLLHYVAANGVEDFRQVTPSNALAIARFLLESGAKVDALANTYGGGAAQTTMNLLVSSVHPHQAGLQSPLADLLLDFGAAINGLEDDCSPLMTAIAFWYGDTAETLARRGARLDNVVAAASVGRLDVVKKFVIDRTTLARDVRNFETRWFSTPSDSKLHIEMAFASSCHFAKADIARFFLELGVDPASKDKDDMTALHWAAATGSLDLVEELLARGAPLEAKNVWGGTVLGSTTFFVTNAPFPGVSYGPVIEALLKAGADVFAADYPTGDERVDDVLRRYRAR